MTKVSCGLINLRNDPAVGPWIFFFILKPNGIIRGLIDRRNNPAVGPGIIFLTVKPNGIIRLPDPKYIIISGHDHEIQNISLAFKTVSKMSDLDSLGFYGGGGTHA